MRAKVHCGARPVGNGLFKAAAAAAASSAQPGLTGLHSACGLPFPQVPVKQKTETFDSNIITPGTGFMHRLSIALQYYVHLRLNNDASWRGIEVRLWGDAPWWLCMRGRWLL